MLPQLEPDPALPLGSEVDGRYRVDAVLDTGGMGVVYDAFDTHHRRRVALKIIASTVQEKWVPAERFANEVRYLERAGSHPNVLQLLDHGTLDGQPYLVTELVEGQRPTAFPLDPVVACRIARDIGRALAHLHQLGIVHRDVKPANIIVDKETGRAKLIDFGLAIELGAAVENDRLTTEFLAAGTPEYMAPEQVGLIEPQPTLDLYAVGTVLYEMLTGLRPYGGYEHSPARLLVKKREETPPPLSSSKVGELPDELHTLVRDCLARDPERRLADAAVFVARLDAVLESLGWREPQRGGSGAWVWVAGAAAVLIAAAVIYGMRPPEIADDGTKRDPPLAASSTMAEAPSKIAKVKKAPRPEPEPPAKAKARRAKAEPEPEPAKASPAKEVPAKAPPAKAKPAPEPPEAKATPARAKAEPEPPPDPTTTPECEQMRTRARAAKTGLDWRAVLRHTAAASCWPATRERVALRVRAFRETRQWSQCVETGRRSKDAQIRRLVESCRARLDP